MPDNLASLVRALPPSISKDVEKFLPLMRRLARTASEATGDLEEDIVQDFLVKLLVASDKFRRESKQTTYIVAVLRNLAFSMMRVTRRRRAASERFLQECESTTRMDAEDKVILMQFLDYATEYWPRGAAMKLIESDDPRKLVKNTFTWFGSE